MFVVTLNPATTMSSSDDDEPRERATRDWEVKAVLDKKIDPVTGDVEYLLEWKNWNGPPTWEPENNCDCKSLIKKFEKEYKQRFSSSSPAQPRTLSPEVVDIETSSCSGAEDVVDRYSDDKLRKKLRLKEIVGPVRDDKGEIYLIVKWHGLSELEKVPLPVLRKHYCQDLVDFLLEKVKWLD